MKILVFGKNGNISRALRNLLLNDKEVTFIQTGKDEVNFLVPEQITKFLDAHKPQIVINAAAYTQVDKAESDVNDAYAINATALGYLAEWCFRNSAELVHFSTDYVFDGVQDTFWNESSPTRPLNVYGKSKLEGEKLIEKSGCKFLILRTSWIFAPEGVNFFLTMMKLGKDKETLKIVSDQIGSPTYSYSIAEAAIKAAKIAHAQKQYPSGIYHVHNSNFTTWYDFATAIFSMARDRNLGLKIQSVQPITTAEYGAPALRPLNSRMDAEKFKKTFGIVLPSWQDKLSDCFEEYLNLQNRK